MIERCLRARLTAIAVAGGAGLASLIAGAAVVMAGQGRPSDWQIGLQTPVTEVARAVDQLHDVVNIIIFAITMFVLVLMLVTLIKFRESANPTPSKTTHNPLLEIAWTAIPVVILLLIAIPSFKLLYQQYSFPKPDLTIKATGYQWYWSHGYPDQGIEAFDSIVIRDEDLLIEALGDDAVEQKYGALTGTARSKALYRDAKPLWQKRGMYRLLSTDNDVVVPVGKVVHVLVTAADVLHAWAIPSFGSKVDAVPGRITTTWFKAEKKGMFYGQCSELCGKDHGLMPISIRVVDQNAFDAWAAAMKTGDTKKAKQILSQADLKDEEEARLAALESAK